MSRSEPWTPEQVSGQGVRADRAATSLPALRECPVCRVTHEDFEPCDRYHEAMEELQGRDPMRSEAFREISTRELAERFSVYSKALEGINNPQAFVDAAKGLRKVVEMLSSFPSDLTRLWEACEEFDEACDIFHGDDK